MIYRIQRQDPEACESWETFIWRQLYCVNHFQRNRSDLVTETERIDCGYCLDAHRISDTEGGYRI